MGEDENKKSEEEPLYEREGFKQALAYSNRTEYSPENCHFSVVFEGKPTIIEAVLDEGILVAEYAELGDEEDISFQKAEFVLYDENKIKFNEDKKVEMIKSYAKNGGLSNPTILKKENENGKYYELRGNKTLKDENNNDVTMIFFMDVYSYKNNFFMVSSTALAKDYPTPKITRFHNSVKSK